MQQVSIRLMGNIVARAIVRPEDENRGIYCVAVVTTHSVLKYMHLGLSSPYTQNWKCVLRHPYCTHTIASATALSFETWRVNRPCMKIFLVFIVLIDSVRRQTLHLAINSEINLGFL